MAETKENVHKYEFKAEIKQLLNILVHSLYTNREIFLRELISNASDALDKVRFESNRGTEIADNDQNLEIRIDFDKDKKILNIHDTGIGMTEDEIVNDIGTIAKSGTAELLNQLQENKEDLGNIIGKFGVGFYSVFMVAKEVVIKTKSYKKDAQPVQWISDGSGSFEVKPLEEKDFKRGTTLEIYLNDDSEEFAEKERLTQIIKKHSNFISFPIYSENERINTIQALWREPKSSISEEQYNEFYKFLTYDTEDPLDIIHISVDAPIQFSSLTFIPKKNFDMFGLQRENYGLDLYVKRVLIQHQNKELLPEYLSFIKGVVDSEDLPLNVSRESLQENVVFNKISGNITKHVLSFLQKMAENEPEKYTEFWNEHSRIFKMGYTDFTNKEKFQELLRFNSSIHEDSKGLTPLKDYVDRMKEGQKEIYYITGNSRESIKLNPHLEIFKNKGMEVLYLLDPIDEFVMSSLGQYGDYELKSADQVDTTKLEEFESVEEDTEEKKEELNKDDQLHFDSLLSKMKEYLGDKVTEVKASKRLKNSPACIVTSEGGMSSAMHKIMQSVNQDTSIPNHSFEVNKDHNLIRNLLSVFKNDPNDDYIKKVTEQLYENSLLQEGYLTDPNTLVDRMNSLLNNSSDWYKNVKNIE